tara:strand:+ start:3742 stop:4410 length:669 start_codon:yes stop_codon:yes gene_type:complete
MNLLSNTVDPQEIYSEGLYAPASPPDSLEILNGGLDSNNYGDTDKTLPVWATKIGAFAAGFYSGFDTWDFIYANQTFDSDVASNDLSQRVIHSSLSSKIFLPWDASVLLYGFQAYFRQDATQVFGESSAQYWDVHVEIGGTDESLYTVLPRTRADASVAYDSGLAHEEYWPYVTKQHMKTSMAQGYHPITISIWSRIDATSFTNRKEKLLTPTGAVWALAIR